MNQKFQSAHRYAKLIPKMKPRNKRVIFALQDLKA